MLNFMGNEYLCKLVKEYLNDLLCKFGPFCLQLSKTFDIPHAFLRVTIAELSTLKQVRFFGPPCIISIPWLWIFCADHQQNSIHVFCGLHCICSKMSSSRSLVL